jgi:hypothetical protein
MLQLLTGAAIISLIIGVMQEGWAQVLNSLFSQFRVGSKVLLFLLQSFSSFQSLLLTIISGKSNSRSLIVNENKGTCMYVNQHFKLMKLGNSKW